MKKLFASILAVFCISLAFALSACNGGDYTSIGNDPETPVTGEEDSLVVYFSQSGNTQKLAHWVAEETGSEIFRILTVQPYPDDYDALADMANEQLTAGTRPELSTHIEEDVMAGYDVIYLGFPIWWYDLPMPVWSFWEEYDFSGKTIIPFFTHHGSSSGAGSIQTIRELCPDAEIVDSPLLSVYDESIDGAQDDVRDWYAELNSTNN